MGKREGDRRNRKGNGLINMWMRLSHITLLFAFNMLHFILRYDDPIRWFDGVLLAIATFGVFVRYWAYMELGNLFTFEIGIRDKHKIITSGPYKYIAHPGYLGQFLTIMMPILFYRPTFLLMVGLVTYVMYQFIKRIKSEEQMLVKEFGVEYIDFLKNRWRMIPYAY